MCLCFRHVCVTVYLTVYVTVYLCFRHVCVTVYLTVYLTVYVTVYLFQACTVSVCTVLTCYRSRT